MESEPIWNSLEIVKVIIAVITPVIGGFIAFKLARIGKDLESKQWTSRKIIEKRLDFYDNVVPVLNDLFCYYNRFGNWKELTPLELIDKKRRLDKDFHIYAHIFRMDILKNYKAFMDNCFKTYTGWGNDAKLKMNIDKREGLPNWNDNWKELFIPEEMVSQEKFTKSYNQLLFIIKKELEIE